MSDPSGDLAKRVSDLEAQVKLLINNLRDNNSDLYQIVDESFALINSGDPKAEDLRRRLKDAIGLRNPPGCVVGGND
jgi:hypothetical protein